MAAYPPAQIEGSEQRDVRARKTGRAYRILVSSPATAAPPQGYPVIWVLDANAVFGTITEAIRLQSARPEITGVVPSLVVGIGYPTAGPLDPVARTLDYTPDVDRSTLPVRPDGTAWPPTGGADAFLDFVETELKPAIAADFPIDRTRQVLFGHSFGGLLSLYALFTRPGAFQAHIASSPSIWLGDRAILAAERAFAERLGDAGHALRLMIAVGGCEQTDPPTERLPSEDAARAAWIARNRMVDNAREMAHRLEKLDRDRLRVAFEEIPGENHVSVIPALVSRALRFALAPAS